MQAEIMKKKPNVLSGKQTYELYSLLRAYQDDVAEGTDRYFAEFATNQLGFTVTDNNVASARAELGITKNKPVNDDSDDKINKLKSSLNSIASAMFGLEDRAVNLIKAMDAIEVRTKRLATMLNIGNKDDSLFLADNGTRTKA